MTGVLRYADSKRGTHSDKQEREANNLGSPEKCAYTSFTRVVSWKQHNVFPFLCNEVVAQVSFGKLCGFGGRGCVVDLEFSVVGFVRGSQEVVEGWSHVGGRPY